MKQWTVYFVKQKHEGQMALFSGSDLITDENEAWWTLCMPWFYSSFYKISAASVHWPVSSVETLSCSLCTLNKWMCSTLHICEYIHSTSSSKFPKLCEIHTVSCFCFSKWFSFIWKWKKKIKNMKNYFLSSFSSFFQIWIALAGQKVIPLLTLNSCVRMELVLQSQNGQAATLALFLQAQSWLGQSLSLKSMTS